MKYILLISICVTIQWSVESTYSNQEDGLNYISFTLNSYRQVYNPNDNFVYAPLALNVIYNILYQVASGNAEARLHEALFANSHVQPEKDEVRETQVQSLAYIARNSGINLANKFYVSTNGTEFDELFKYLVKRYQATSENIDFGLSEQARNIMNYWVETQTDGLIRDLIQDGQIQPFTDMIVINTVYFKAEWLRKFTEYQVRDGVFNAITGGPSPARFIEDTSNYDISFRPSLGIYVLRLPYSNGYEFWIILPFATYGLQNLVQSLSAEHMIDIKQNFATTYAQIKFPIFSIESRVNGKDAKSDAFLNPDFSFKNGTESFIGAIIQKTKIIVNIEGTDVASGTYGAAIGLPSFQRQAEPFYFIADRPFLYAVMTEDSRPILFGHYAY